MQRKKMPPAFSTESSSLDTLVASGTKVKYFNFIDVFCSKDIPLTSRRNRKPVSELRCDLHNRAPTQMIDGTEKPKIPSKFSKHAARYNEFGSNIIIYYFTITSFYHIRTGERAKYESVLHCSKRITL